MPSFPQTLFAMRCFASAALFRACLGTLALWQAEATSSSYVGTEFTMDVPVPTIFHGGASVSPSVAGNGTQYMVAWEVQRDRNYIFAARLALGGEAFAEEPILVGEGSRPAIAASDSCFLVTWQTPERSYLTFGRIRAALVMPDGEIRPLPDLALSGADPAVASNRRDFLVVWVDSSAVVYGRRVTADGQISAAIDLTLNEPRSIKERPRVASNGSDYLAVWHDGWNFHTNSWDIYGTALSAEGSVLHGGSIPIATGSGPQVNAAISSDGRGYFVVWQDQGIAGRTVTGGQSHLPGPTTRLATNGYSPEVIFDGAAYQSLWLGPESENVAWVKGVRVATTGEVLESAPRRFAESTNFFFAFPLRAAAQSNEIAVVWSREGQIRGVFLDSNGMREPALPVPLDQNDEEWPAVAGNGSRFLVVWRDNRNFTKRGWEIYGTTVDTNGRALNPHGIAITSTATDAAPLLPQGENDFRPRVASNGRGFLVVWQQFGLEVRAARLSEFGQPLASEPLIVASNAVESAVASDGTNYLVAWIRPSPMQSDLSVREIRGALVSPTGGIMEPGEFLISGFSESKLGLQIAGNGTNYLVVWHDANRILSTIVTADGSVAFPQGMAVATVGPVSTSVTAMGTGYYVVWAAEEIYARRVTADGTPLGGGSRVSFAADSEVTPAVAAFSEVEVFLVWAIPNPSLADLMGAHITGGGAGFDRFAIRDTSARGKFTRPAIAQIGSRFLVVYEGPGTAGGRRIFGRFLDPSMHSIVVPPAFVLTQPRGSIVSNRFEIALLGDPEALYQIDVSTNLIDWSPWKITSTPALRIRDRTVGGLPQRFYRAVKR